MADTHVTDHDLIAGETLLRRAAALKGLTLKRWDSRSGSSEPVASYPISPALVETLIEHGFSWQHRPDISRYTLSDERSYQSGSVVSPTWLIFYKEENELRLAPAVDLHIRITDRAVVLQPCITGFSSAGVTHPTHQESHNRLLEALVAHFADAPVVLRELLAAADGKLSIPWKDIDAAGVRPVVDLFDEHFSRNDLVRALSRSHHLSPFDPSPNHPTLGTAFVPEHLQGALFRQWREQLEDFKRRL